MPPRSLKPTPIPSSFTDKKTRILSSLQRTEGEYEDKSPKGSIDAGCLSLINQINAYDGLVTTSSCAGRVSIFVEGSKDPDVTTRGVGGKWLFISHDPIQPDGLDRIIKSLNLPPGLDSTYRQHNTGAGTRLIRLSFEPLILHVMAASLTRAAPLLTAAINAGFRESGVSSLRNLDDQEACPVVAIRTKGLGLETVLGFVVTGPDEREGYEWMVEENGLKFLLGLANERFQGNEERKIRLGEEIARAMERAVGLDGVNGWEGQEERRARKIREGLRKKAEIEKQRLANGAGSNGYMELNADALLNG